MLWVALDSASLTRNLKRVTISLVATSSMLLPLHVRADIRDKQSYWYGFLVGSGITVCALLDIGLLSRNDATDWLTEIFKQRSDIPSAAMESAKQHLAEELGPKGCPVPR